MQELIKIEWSELRSEMKGHSEKLTALGRSL